MSTRERLSWACYGWDCAKQGHGSIILELVNCSAFRTGLREAALRGLLAYNGITEPLHLWSIKVSLPRAGA